METYADISVPDILFAHKFTADEYHTVLPAAENRVELTCVTDGAFTAMRGRDVYQAFAGDIVCNFFASDVKIDADAPHTHHTVCFTSDSGFGYLRKLPFVISSNQAFAHCLRLTDEIIRIRALYPDDRMRVAGLFLQIAGELLSDETGPDVSPGDRLYAERAKNYIYEHINEPISQRDVARHLGISPEYLCYVFKRSEGRSLIRFSNELKLENIRDLIATKGLTLSKAAAQYGFADPNYVSRLYRKYFNKNITDKRKQTGLS